MNVVAKVPAKSRKWHAPSSVLNALWGEIMAKLAVSVWRAELGISGNKLWSGLGQKRGAALHLASATVRKSGKGEKAFVDFWNMLATITFPGGYTGGPVGPVQRQGHVVLEYFHPAPPAGHRGVPRANWMEIWLRRAEGYDFVLHSKGLDLFVPPRPWNRHRAGWEKTSPEAKQRQALREIIRMYKFRETGSPPIGLPCVPASGVGDDYFISVPQLSAPTGASQLDADWVRDRPDDIGWWITGAAYRGVMDALPRIIASMWYEAAKFPDSGTDGYVQRFYEPGGLKRLLEQRLELTLHEDMQIEVAKPTSGEKRPGWNPRDVMITERGLTVPDPGGEPPELGVVLDAIENGAAGNPVFTNSGASGPPK